MGLNVPGLAASVIFYVLIVVVGFWGARRRQARTTCVDRSEDLMLGGRSVSLVVGVFTVIGISPDTRRSHLRRHRFHVATLFLACPKAPAGAILKLPIGYSDRARRHELSDTKHDAPGPNLIPEVTTRSRALKRVYLNFSGATVSVITGLGHVTCVTVTASVVTLYTCVGGLYSITYTDVLQLLLMFFGLVREPKALPIKKGTSNIFLRFYPPLSHIVLHLKLTSRKKLTCFLACLYLHQNLFQRVLSAKTEFRAKALPYAGCLGTLVLSVPVLLLGLVARAARWQETAYAGEAGSKVSPLDDESQWSLLLPLTLQHLTPASVSFLGQGAIAAAAMSSADACMLSTAALFTKNVYVPLIRPMASEGEKVWVLRCSIATTAVLSSAVAVTVDSVYGLSVLMSDLVYVVLFPQLLAVVHFPSLCNAYGSLAAILVGFGLRVVGGEPVLGLPALLHYPFFDEAEQRQLFPLKTAAMLASLATLVLTSVVVEAAFRLSPLSPRYCVLRRQIMAAATDKADHGERNGVSEPNGQVGLVDCTSRSADFQAQAFSSV
ncbi:unnamed protein product [Ixodes hexagonus]